MFEDSASSAGKLVVSRHFFREVTKIHETAGLFGVALWSDMDHENDGIPAGTGLSISILAELPAVPGIVARERVRERLILEDLRPLLALAKPLRTESVSDNLAKLSSLVHAGRAGLKPSAALATRWFDQLIQWQPEEIKRTDAFAVSTFRWATDELRQRIGELLQEVIAPTMDAGDRTAVRATALTAFISRTETWRALPALPYFLAADRTTSDEVCRAIRRGLTRSDEAHVVGATNAVVKWTRLVKEHLVTEVPRPLIEKLVDAIEVGHRRGLEFLVKATASLVVDGFLTMEDMATQYTAVEIESPLAVSASIIRAACPRLAQALLPQVANDAMLHQWVEDAKVDPLPEVRFSLITDTMME
jgi:hypothetical protein